MPVALEHAVLEWFMPEEQADRNLKLILGAIELNLINACSLLPI
jgi:hypothetical protein